MASRGWGHERENSVHAAAAGCSLSGAATLIKGAAPFAAFIGHPGPAIPESHIVGVQARLQHWRSPFARQGTRHVASEQPCMQAVGPARPRLTLFDCMS